MAAGQYDFYNFAAGTVNVPTTTETVVGTTKSISTGYAGQIMLVQFTLEFTAGTGATSVIAKIERGSAAGGTAIRTSPSITVVAANIYNWTFVATDQLTGDVAGQVYVLTLTQAAATGNGTAQNAASAVTVG